MSRNPLVRLLGLSLALLLAACAAYQAQHGQTAAGEGHDHAAPSVVRPSGEFSELTADGQVARIRGEVEEVKATLAEKGKYACCVHPPCTECLLRYGECHCREAVRKQGPCCGECTEAWIEGRGTVEGVTAWEVLEKKKQVLDEVNRKKGGSEPEPPHQHY
ncbi:MAG TPA: hypothetical protein VGG03_11935 [Thermoanaerobaculia bacterium]|jgi:hypothetical protein